MIFTNWYSFSSIRDESSPDRRHYPDLCCKHCEFFRLWWLYANRWCWQGCSEPFANHVYVCDSGSPISLEPILQELGVSYEVLEPGRADSYTLDPAKRVHLMRYPVALDHFHGSARAHIDYLKCCYQNELDYLLLESDVLVAYDLPTDYANTDFYTQKIKDHGLDTIYQGAICFIDKACVAEAFNNGGMERYVTGDINQHDFHESQVYGLFCRGRTKEMDAHYTTDGYGRDPLRPYVHKTTPPLLKQFLTEHYIPSPYVNEYLEYLDVA